MKDTNIWNGFLSLKQENHMFVKVEGDKQSVGRNAVWIICGWHRVHICTSMFAWLQHYQLYMWHSKHWTNVFCFFSNSPKHPQAPFQLYMYMCAVCLWITLLKWFHMSVRHMYVRFFCSWSNRGIKKNANVYLCIWIHYINNVETTFFARRANSCKYLL